MSEIDAFFAEENANRRAADGQVTPEQSALKPGDHCARQVGDIIVISEILDPVESLLSGRPVDDLDDEERGELEAVRDSYADPDMRHYRFTRSYSVACPHGELGDIHVSAVTPIPREVFDRVKASL